MIGLARGVTILLLGWVAGCTALNPAYEEREAGGDAGTGGVLTAGTTGPVPSDTTTSTSSAGATSAAEADTSPLHLDQGNGEAETGIASTTTGPWDLCPTDVQIVEDAFLVSCGGSCSSSNFGITPLRGVGPGSHLLLRLPSGRDMTAEVALTVTFVAQASILDVGYELAAYAVTPPCGWIPGLRNAMPPMDGESGVTWQRCDAADPNSAWGNSELSAFDHVDSAWQPGTVALTSDTITPGESSKTTLTLTRGSLGLAPESILLVSDAPNVEGLVLSATESADPMSAVILHACD